MAGARFPVVAEQAAGVRQVEFFSGLHELRRCGMLQVIEQGREDSGNIAESGKLRRDVSLPFGEAGIEGQDLAWRRESLSEKERPARALLPGIHCRRISRYHLA